MRKICKIYGILFCLFPSIVNYAQTLSGQTTTSNTATPNTSSTDATIEFVGDANIQKSLSSGDGIPANTGLGVIYKETLPKRYKWLYSIEMGLTINVASTADSLKTSYTSNTVNNKSDFGNSILLPLNSGQAFNFSFKGYFTKPDTANHNCKWSRTPSSSDVPLPIPILNIISGMYVNFAGSNRNWSDSLSKTTVKASNVSTQVGIFHEFIDPKDRENYSLTLGIGYSARWLLGDVAEEQYSSLRQNILGTTKTGFNGWEVILAFRLKNIQAEVHVPFLSQKNGIPGLSGVQPNTFIGFSGGFPLKLN
jgi:hypothetical protein